MKTTRKATKRQTKLNSIQEPHNDNEKPSTNAQDRENEGDLTRIQDNKDIINEILRKYHEIENSGNTEEIVKLFAEYCEVENEKTMREIIKKGFLTRELKIIRVFIMHVVKDISHLLNILLNVDAI